MEVDVGDVLYRIRYILFFMVIILSLLILSDIIILLEFSITNEVYSQMICELIIYFVSLITIIFLIKKYNLVLIEH